MPNTIKEQTLCIAVLCRGRENGAIIAVFSWSVRNCSQTLTVLESGHVCVKGLKKYGQPATCCTVRPHQPMRKRGSKHVSRSKGKSFVFFFFWSPFVSVQRNMTERMNKKKKMQRNMTERMNKKKNAL